VCCSFFNPLELRPLPCEVKAPTRFVRLLDGLFFSSHTRLHSGVPWGRAKYATSRPRVA